MEWLNKRLHFGPGDLGLLEFDPSVPFKVHTIKVSKNNQGQFEFEHKEHEREETYIQWALKQKGPTIEPGVYIVMHPQLPAASDPGYRELGHGMETFESVSKSMFQHRSIVSLTRRISTSVFNSRTVVWPDQPQLGPSIVYNCKSDDESPAGPNCMAMSVTCFPQASVTFATLYGCTERTIADVSGYLLHGMKWDDGLHHPIFMPMVFAELERMRLLNALERSGDSLSQRIVNLKLHMRDDEDDDEDGMLSSSSPAAAAGGTSAHIENETPGRRWTFFWRLRGSATDSRRGSGEKRAFSTSAKECEATELWIQVSSLKNGLESFRAQIRDMLDHYQSLARPGPPVVPVGSGLPPQVNDLETGTQAEMRLKHMLAELDCKIRRAEGVLAGMVMAMQVEWNYHTRRDAKATIIIAKRTKLDSGQMRTISRLGMVFLPGTFLATIFSMSFFKWIPENSSEVVSPWIAVFFLLAFLATGITWWWFSQLMGVEGNNENADIEIGLASDAASGGEPNFTFRKTQ